MRNRELIEILRTKGEQRARALWKEAEEEARRLRQEMETRLQNAREEIAGDLERFEDKEIADRLQQNREKSRRIVLDAERRLAERCYKLATEMLKHLGEEDREGMLRQLAEEIPEARWETITVNGRDGETAGQLFPKLEIETDNSISGGFCLATADRQITVNNTLETRLQRNWSFLLPELFHNIRENLNVHEAGEDQNL